MLVFETSYKDDTAETAVKELFRRSGMSGKEDDIAESLATVLLGRVRKRYRDQKNPDGTKWKTSKDARTRISGGYTWAKGGKYATGSKPRRKGKKISDKDWALSKKQKEKLKWKTGGFTLFSSGNMFHSITLKKKEKASYSIYSDVPYAIYYMNKNYTIIGTTEEEVDKLIKAALGRIK